jgi:hypothetical protein
LRYLFFFIYNKYRERERERERGRERERERWKRREKIRKRNFSGCLFFVLISKLVISRALILSHISLIPNTIVGGLFRRATSFDMSR